MVTGSQSSICVEYLPFKFAYLLLGDTYHAVGAQVEHSVRADAQTGEAARLIFLDPDRGLLASHPGYPADAGNGFDVHDGGGNHIALHLGEVGVNSVGNTATGVPSSGVIQSIVEGMKN